MRRTGKAGVWPNEPRNLLVARSAHAPHADGSVRPKLGVLAEDPEAASTGAVTGCGSNGVTSAARIRR